MLAAIAGIAVFSLIAFQVLASDRGAIAGAEAQYEQARLEAAADAGVMAAVHGLGVGNSGLRWPIDGRTQTLTVDGVAVTISIEDERGKVALNDVDSDTIRRLLAGAGVTGTRLNALVDAIGDWEDDDDDRRPLGAEAPDYAALHIAPRNGSFRTVEELMAVQGMDAGLFSRVAPLLSVFAKGGFDAKTAPPQAVAAMSFGGANSVEELEREREMAGQRVAIDLSAPASIVGRALTVRVIARTAGGTLRRAVVVELTGDTSHPYWIRALN